MFLRLDIYFIEHLTLLIEDYENIIDIFRFCVKRNEHLLKSRNIEHSKPDDSTDRPDTDVAMEESVVPRALSAQGSTSLVDLILCHQKLQGVGTNTTGPTISNVFGQEFN